MSADNWSKCPRCAAKRSSEIVKAHEKADASYGKVSVDAFDELRRKACDLEAAQLPQSLREDYELGVNEDRTFDVTYVARCNECAFEFRFKHNQDIDL